MAQKEKRDRTRAMKWVEELAQANPDPAVIEAEVRKKVAKESTVSFQLRALRKHGILPPLPEGEKPAKKVKEPKAKKEKAPKAEKPFKPQPKTRKKKK